MKKQSKKIIKNLIGGIIITLIILAIFKILGIVINWLMVDTGRYMLGIGIIGFIAYKLLKRELDD